MFWVFLGVIIWLWNATQIYADWRSDIRKQTVFNAFATGMLTYALIDVVF